MTAAPSTVMMSIAEVEAFAMRILLANGTPGRPHRTGHGRGGSVGVPLAWPVPADRLCRQPAQLQGQRHGPTAARTRGRQLLARGRRSALIEAAKNNGIAALALTRCYHYSALWNDLEPIVDAGLACWAFTVVQCIVAPHGGNRRLMGTNPIAVGWPRAG